MWNDAAQARKIMRERQRLDAAIDTVHTLYRYLSDTIALIEFGVLEDDVAIVA